MYSDSITSVNLRFLLYEDSIVLAVTVLQPFKKKEDVCKLNEHEERSKVVTLQSLP